jgi:hypothetical protein
LTDDVWTNYLRGILFQLKLKDYEIGGFNCVFSSNIPTGSGLSSSAALECGFLFGINELFNLGIKPIDIALMGQSAEHWVGINCGIMDQFSSVMGLENKVIKIDCRTLDYTYHDANFVDYSLILFDSNVKHSLFTSEYNNITGTPDIVFSNIPPYFATLPTEQDYQNGEFRRYFCKKTNEILYIEISKTTFDLLINKSPDILWPLYSPFNIAWQLTGGKEQVARINKNIVDLTSVRLQLPKFGDYLNNNYLKYYR